MCGLDFACEALAAVQTGTHPWLRHTTHALHPQSPTARHCLRRYVVQWVSGSRAVQQVEWGFAADKLDGAAALSTAVTYTAAQM